jgi:hypothetical protein
LPGFQQLTLILIINYHVGYDKKNHLGEAQKNLGVVGGLALKTILFLGW